MGLVRFALGRDASARRVVLVHGESNAKKMLEKRLRQEGKRLGMQVDVQIA
jgi:hypothetical protein